MNNFNKDLIENINLLYEIKKKEEFCSVWSTDIKAEKINDVFPEKINFVSYKGMTEKVGKTNKKGVTYLDLWKTADKLIARCEDDHVFIEDFTNYGNGNFELETGS